jgi:hypothetical protein
MEKSTAKAVKTENAARGQKEGRNNFIFALKIAWAEGVRQA